MNGCWNELWVCSGAVGQAFAQQLGEYCLPPESVFGSLLLSFAGHEERLKCTQQGHGQHAE